MSPALLSGSTIFRDHPGVRMREDVPSAEGRVPFVGVLDGSDSARFRAFPSLSRAFLVPLHGLRDHGLVSDRLVETPQPTPRLCDVVSDVTPRFAGLH